MKCNSVIFLTITLITLLPAFITSEALSQTENTPDTTVVIVNDTPITEADVNLEVKRILFQAKAMQQPIDESMMGSMRDKVINSLINRELLYQQSKTMGITTNAAEIDNSIDQIKQRLEAGQSFENLLAEMGITTKTMRAQVGQANAIQKLMEMVVYPRAMVSEKESRIFFENNPQYFKKPEEVKASHILIQVAPDAGNEEKLAARKKIEDIQKKLEAGGDFADLARQYSEGPSKVSGGDLGYFDRKKMVKPFADAAFALKPGEVSDIVETRFGFHLIKVYDKKAKSVYVFENIKDRLTEMLRQQKIQDETVLYIEELRKTADVKRITQ
ncbi:MAG: peptidylprolyl isomerase [Desulfobacterales bacterium]|nr:peptidylprolyl isomerase [Desulfobacterales bacterium]MDX2511892.1 peptidylprolyl isomerase [Desulfobacterales bacterium]